MAYRTSGTCRRLVTKRARLPSKMGVFRAGDSVRWLGALDVHAEKPNTLLDNFAGLLTLTRIREAVAGKGLRRLRRMKGAADVRNLCPGEN